MIRTRWVGTILIAAGSIALAALAFGPLGAVVAGICAFLFAAIRHDNDLGTCFPLALLFVLIPVVLTLLIVMLGMFASR